MSFVEINKMLQESVGEGYLFNFHKTAYAHDVFSQNDDIFLIHTIAFH